MSDTHWCVLDASVPDVPVLVCRRCDARLPMALPIAMRAFDEVTTAFVIAHASCLPRGSR